MGTLLRDNLAIFRCSQHQIWSDDMRPETVGLGRLPCMGLAAAGEAGLVRVLELLEDEVRICLGLLGVTRLADLDPSYLQAAPAVSLPHVTSAFPLLDEDGY